MHPLRHALQARGMTQRQLAKAVTALRWKRDNGRKLRLKQNSVSQICSFKRRVTPEVARAIARILDGSITAEILLLVPRRLTKRVISKQRAA
jgi:transcriptional regulator with XRE-family HTH domain